MKGRTFGPRMSLHPARAGCSDRAPELPVQCGRQLDDDGGGVRPEMMCDMLVTLTCPQSESSTAAASSKTRPAGHLAGLPTARPDAFKTNAHRSKAMLSTSPGSDPSRETDQE